MFSRIWSVWGMAQRSGNSSIKYPWLVVVVSVEVWGRILMENLLTYQHAMEGLTAQNVKGNMWKFMSKNLFTDLYVKKSWIKSTDQVRANSQTGSAGAWSADSYQRISNTGRVLIIELSWPKTNVWPWTLGRTLGWSLSCFKFVLVIFRSLY